MNTDRLGNLFHSFNSKYSFDDDGFSTLTSTDQKRVEDTVLEEAARYMNNRAEGERAPSVLRTQHAAYLLKRLHELPSSYSSLDSSRPWLCYWAVHALNLLRVEIPDETKCDIVRFLKTCEDSNGGYGGGPGQMAHLATTYAAVLALASLASHEALASIDRAKILSFLHRMHHSNGSFTMHDGGETDVRGSYLALAVANLLRIVDDNLTNGTAEWIVGCQTYEGGFGGERGTEAHGGYTFCAMAALSLLGRARLADISALLRWVARRQMQFEGGFQGRTNKLVDGCYSFWVGSLFRIIECQLASEGEVPLLDAFDSRALQEYALVICQDEKGGLLDKPGKRCDLYHTCYVLSGISIAQSFVEDKTQLLGGINNTLEETHPVYNITVESEQFAKDYFSRDEIAQ